MRAVLMTVLVLAGTPAMACNADFIAVDEWSIKERRGEPPTGAEVDISYRLVGDKAYRLIDGSFLFADALGMDLGRIAIPRTSPLKPDQAGTDHGVYLSTQLMMAARMNPEDVRVTTCVRAVIYDDGTKEEF